MPPSLVYKSNTLDGEARTRRQISQGAPTEYWRFAVWEIGFSQRRVWTGERREEERMERERVVRSVRVE